MRSELQKEGVHAERRFWRPVLGSDPQAENCGSDTVGGNKQARRKEELEGRRPRLVTWRRQLFLMVIKCGAAAQLCYVE